MTLLTYFFISTKFALKKFLASIKKILWRKSLLLLLFLKLFKVFIHLHLLCAFIYTYTLFDNQLWIICQILDMRWNFSGIGIRLLNVLVYSTNYNKLKFWDFIWQLNFSFFSISIQNYKISGFQLFFLKSMKIIFSSFFFTLMKILTKYSAQTHNCQFTIHLVEVFVWFLKKNQK